METSVDMELSRAGRERENGNTPPYERTPHPELRHPYHGGSDAHQLLKIILQRNAPHFYTNEFIHISTKQRMVSQQQQCPAALFETEVANGRSGKPRQFPGSITNRTGEGGEQSPEPGMGDDWVVEIVEVKMSTLGNGDANFGI